jgi:hypothetical protein
MALHKYIDNKCLGWMREAECKETQGGIATTFSKKRKDMVSFATGCFKNVKNSPSYFAKISRRKNCFYRLTAQS